MTDDEIKEGWRNNANTASAQGTWFHGVLERHMNGENIDDAPYAHLTPLRQFIKWRDTEFVGKLVPFRTELRFRSDAQLKLTGTKKISFSNWFEMGVGLCSALDNCNYSHYFLQQNIYKWLLETYYSRWTWKGGVYTSVQVDSMQLCVFHQNHDSDTGLQIDIPCDTKLIEAMMEKRREHVVGELPVEPGCDTKLIGAVMENRRERVVEELLVAPGSE